MSKDQGDRQKAEIQSLHNLIKSSAQNRSQLPINLQPQNSKRPEDNKQEIVANKDKSILRFFSIRNVLSKSFGTLKSIIDGSYKAFDGGIKFLDNFIGFLIGTKTDSAGPALAYTRGPAVFGAYIVLIFVIGGGIWAAVAPLDSATGAVGSLIYSGRKKVVQYNNNGSNSSGTVKEILVNLGDRVKKGDPIMIIEDLQPKARLASTRVDYLNNLAIKHRILAEEENLERINYPKELQNLNDPEISKIVRLQDDAFRAKKLRLQSQIDRHQSTIRQSKVEVAGLKQRLKNLEERLKSSEQMYQRVKTLHERKVDSIETLRRAEADKIEAQNAVHGTRSEIVRIEERIKEIEYMIATTISSEQSENLKQLTDAESNIEKLTQNLKEIQDTLDKTIIRATEDGTINELHIYNPGAVISAGSPVAEISPDADRNELVIEARISPKDIAVVHADEKVKIKFSAFKSRTSPTFIGKVAHVSHDAIQDKNKVVQQSGASGGEPAYYIALIELDMSSFERYPEQRAKLRPGMQAEISIVHGTRTLLQYLLSQMSDQVFKSLNER